MGGNVPLGYAPDGRTLRIVEEEAQIVRQLFDFYEEHGSILEAKRQADRMGLRSKPRIRKRKAVQGQEPSSAEGGGSTDAGEVNGAPAARAEECTDAVLPFARSQIHYILTNPVYAGCIRHHDKVHDGQHPAIIAPARFDAVQAQLAADAARERGHSGTNRNTSLLAGKLYDETGDRLTPSHANKKGRRYRYYVSNRMISGTGRRGDGVSNGWRLPAKALEDQIAKAVLAHLRDHIAVDLLHQLGR